MVKKLSKIVQDLFYTTCWQIFRLNKQKSSNATLAVVSSVYLNLRRKHENNFKNLHRIDFAILLICE